MIVLRYSLMALLMLMLLPACSFWKDKPEKTPAERAASRPAAETLYEEGKAAIGNRRFEAAIEKLQEIERLYPFSRLTAKGKVLIAYAYYQDEEYDDAIGVVDNFAKLHPAHEDLGYMLYLKALGYYDRITDVKRDQQITMQALAALEEVTKRFPDTDYARDTRLKRDLVRDHLAGKEMEIGRFYLKRNQPIAAINRFKKVVANYDDTSQVEEALYRLAEAYTALGIRAEAQKYAAVLGHNYSNSRWYDYAYGLVEKGESAPAGMSEGWFDWFEDDEAEALTPLPTENEAEGWLDKIWNVF